MRLLSFPDAPQAQVVAAVGSAASSLGAVVTNSWAVMVFGVDLSTVLAAFAGAMISLTFLPPQGGKLCKIAGVILAGTVIGAYVAPLLRHAPSILLAGMQPFPAVAEKPIAFLIGLTVQVTIPALLERIKRIGGNP